MAERITDAELQRIYDDTIVELYGFASRRCGGQRELAEDVTQETWLRAVRDWHRTGVPEKPVAWLTAVARNLIFNHFRRRESVPLDALSPAQVLRAFDESAVGDSAELSAVVTHALTRIPVKEAALLEAFHLDQRKVSHIAAEYRISERAVEGRLRRARERLRHELERTLKNYGGHT